MKLGDPVSEEMNKITGLTGCVDVTACGVVKTAVKELVGGYEGDLSGIVGLGCVRDGGVMHCAGREAR